MEEVKVNRKAFKLLAVIVHARFVTPFLLPLCEIVV
jgi:hypothetical protein